MHARRRQGGLLAILAGVQLTAAFQLQLDNPETQPQRVAILVSGTAERLQVGPLLSNVVRPNAALGLAIDLFFSLHAQGRGAAERRYAASRNESKWLREEDASMYTMDPKVRAGLGDYADPRKFFAALCQWALAAKAHGCEAELERISPVELPDDDAHRSMITFYSPLETTTGESLLRRWRSLEGLWAKVREAEAARGFGYDQVLVVRDDDFWLEPYRLDTAEFREEPLTLRTIDCLEAHGINDKVLHMGRAAAAAVLPAYTAWVRGARTEVLHTRNAEEFLLRMAEAGHAVMTPRAMPVAIATITRSGIPCFRKQKFDLTSRGGYRKCYGEQDENGPRTKLFRAFNCDDLNPHFFRQLSAEDATTLHAAIEAGAGESRSPVILTVVDLATVFAVRRMLKSLAIAGEKAAVVLVGAAASVCAMLTRDGPLADGVTCVQMTRTHAKDQLELGRLKLAVLTAAAAAGLTEGLIVAAPDITVIRPLSQPLHGASAGRDVLLSAAARPCAASAAAAAQPAQALLEADGRLLHLRDSTGAVAFLLRAWLLFEEAAPKDAPGGRAALPRALTGAALRSRGAARVGPAPQCGLLAPGPSAGACQC